MFARIVTFFGADTQAFRKGAREVETRVNQLQERFSKLGLSVISLAALSRVFVSAAQAAKENTDATNENVVAFERFLLAIERGTNAISNFVAETIGRINRIGEAFGAFVLRITGFITGITKEDIAATEERIRLADQARIAERNISNERETQLEQNQELIEQSKRINDLLAERNKLAQAQVSPDERLAEINQQIIDALEGRTQFSTPDEATEEVLKLDIERLNILKEIEDSNRMQREQIEAITERLRLSLQERRIHNSSLVEQESILREEMQRQLAIVNNTAQTLDAREQAAQAVLSLEQRLNATIEQRQSLLRQEREITNQIRSLEAQKTAELEAQVEARRRAYDFTLQELLAGERGTDRQRRQAERLQAEIERQQRRLDRAREREERFRERAVDEGVRAVPREQVERNREQGRRARERIEQAQQELENIPGLRKELTADSIATAIGQNETVLKINEDIADLRETIQSIKEAAG